jgi:GMP synthase PP-ATPase subunit
MNLDTTLNELKPEHKERLRSAMKILIEYLREHGHLASVRQVHASIEEKATRQVPSSLTVISSE